jgi:hypothetical protein
MPILKTKEQQNAQRKPDDDTTRKSIPKDNTYQKMIPHDRTQKTHKAASFTSSGTGSTHPETHRTMLLPILNGSTNNP